MEDKKDLFALGISVNRYIQNNLRKERIRRFTNPVVINILENFEFFVKNEEYQAIVVQG